MNRQDRAWRNTSAQFKRDCQRANLPCGICGQPIDYTLSGRDPWGFSTDHLTPIAKGGQLLPGTQGLRPAHLRCNSSRGAGRTTRRASRRW